METVLLGDCTELILRSYKVKKTWGLILGCWTDFRSPGFEGQGMQMRDQGLVEGRRTRMHCMGMTARRVSGESRNI